VLTDPGRFGRCAVRRELRVLVRRVAHPGTASCASRYGELRVLHREFGISTNREVRSR